MTRICGLAAAALLLFSACSKSDDSRPAIDPNDNSFSINGERFAILEGYFDNTELRGRDTFGNVARVTFRGSNPDDGSYEAVNLDTLGAGQVYLSYIRRGAYFFYEGNPPARVTVSTTAGRRRVSVPAVWVKNSGSGDSLKFSCNIIQTRY